MAASKRVLVVDKIEVPDAKRSDLILDVTTGLAADLSLLPLLSGLNQCSSMYDPSSAGGV